MSTATTYKVHPDHPEASKLARVAEALAAGAIVAYPTDTVYAIGCDPRVRQSVERLRRVKPSLAAGKALTLLCPSLAGIARYAYVDDAAFRLMKALTPGPYTFILRATREVPRLVLNPRRKTVGLRIPHHPIPQGLLARLDGLILSTSAKLDDDAEPQTREELFAALAAKVDVLVDDGRPARLVPSTMIDLTGPDHAVVREGLGMEALQSFMR